MKVIFNLIQYSAFFSTYFFVFFLSSSCVDKAMPLTNLKTTSISMPGGEKFEAFIAKTYEEQAQGLSGIKNKDFLDHQAMLFVYAEDGMRQFWMPNTYFNLDIIFLTSDFYILDIHRNLPHYPRKEINGKVPKSKIVFARHVLEVKSSSKLAKKLHVGMQLSVTDKKNL